MKKTSIWILAVIMAITFFSLLYLQIDYLRVSVKMRSDHFDEAIKRSLYQVSKNLEIGQTKKFLFQDLEAKEGGFSLGATNKGSEQNVRYKQRITSIGDTESGFLLEYEEIITSTPSSLFRQPDKPGNAITRASSDMQEEYMRRYLYERENWYDVITKIVETSSNKPLSERVDFKGLEADIKNEISNNGISLPFFYEVVDKDDKVIYKNSHFKEGAKASVYPQILFPNDPPDRHTYLKVYFPTKLEYIKEEVSFLVPAIIFTVILLITFIIIISIIFRQKRLTEMKNDFMNNMTHELKTPVSTISLAAQMLKDSSVAKSPEMFTHISSVINDETERLSFQVEKVLQMSLFDRQKATLKLRGIEMNDLIASVANTFQLKVQKFGGDIDVDLQAIEATVSADKMHITNVLFNLLDNAVKYRKETEPLELMLRTWNNGNKLFVSVEDNGIGIKKEDVKKVFERFYRVSTGNRHDVKGFGLGLTYVKKIVEDHQGTIKAESNPSRGTKFIICLPFIKEKVD